MPAESPSRFLEQLRVLCRHEVDFIVVGGVAAVFEGAPIVTYDLDVVFQNTPSNVKRLSSALRAIKARYKDPANRLIEPDEEKLSAFETSLLVTELGALDVLRLIGRGLDYDALFPLSNPFEVAEMQLRVLGLATIIETKEHADRDKDRAVLPILRRTLTITRGG